MLKETFINNEKLISEQTLMCLFRSILEPVLDNNIQSKIILNIDNTLLFSGIIERLKFSHKDYAINEQKYNLPENYNYLLILTENENSLLIWEKNETKYKYSLNINNKFINEFTQKLNIKTNNTNNSSLLNNSIQKIIEYTDKSMINNVLPNKEKQEYDLSNVRFISHEIKKQLSICDLYTEILIKFCEKNNINDETILKSADFIKRAVTMAGNSLLELKSLNNIELKKYKINDLLTESLNLSKVYAMNKNINFYINLDNNSEILADKNKFEAVIINVIKNACEAFDDEITEEKKITITTKEENNFISIIISNNAKQIEDAQKIFDDGYTTKSTGNGYGLAICKKTIENLSGKFELLKSDKTSTDFRILMSII